LHSANSSLISMHLLFLLCLLCCSGRVKPHLRVEDNVAKWCVRQFPKQLTKNHTIESRVSIEPFVGEWCVAQFAEQLSSLNSEQIIKELYVTHEEVETQIFQWGDDASATAGGIPLEPNLGAWCVATWPGNFSPDINLAEVISKNEVPIEALLGGWCFESFPDGLKSLDRGSEIITLYQNHKDIEKEIFEWYQAEKEHSFESSENTLIAILVAVLACILVVIILMNLVLFCRRRSARRNNNTANRTLADITPPEIKVTDII